MPLKLIIPIALKVHSNQVARGKKPIEKNVIVTDEFGNKLTSTYPKRAKGLIKKGRAERVGENEIRLIGCSVTPYMEDNMNNTLNITDNNNNTVTVSVETGEVIENSAQTENIAEAEAASIANEAVQTGGDLTNENETREQSGAKLLYFNPRSFKPNKDCTNTKADRSFISNPFGNGLTEAYTIGNWSWDWSQIDTADMVLDKNTDYEFVFWLNGGENDTGNETCRLEITFDNDHENRYIYNLNRSFIRYEKHYKGWYLYRIPFNTGDACYTKLSFISMRAYTTIIKAETPESYNNISEDLPPEGIPQRHNIIFSEGFPRNSWWSSKVFPDIPVVSHVQHTQNYSSGSGINIDIDVDEIMDGIRERIEGEVDVDGITDEIMDDIDVDWITDGIRERIERDVDVDDITNEIMGSLGIDSATIKDKIVQQIKANLEF
ncbi:MAG: hypothetical protein HDT48_03160 [Ruminococcaceae bacterium]|nr:hypothetical protein [Oscillospiraceae bacterium]